MRISDWSSDVCSSDLQPVVTRSRRPLAVLQAAGGLKVSEAHLFPAGRQNFCRIRDGAAQAKQLSGAAFQGNRPEIGRASRRERVWPDVSIAVGPAALKKKRKEIVNNNK